MADRIPNNQSPSISLIGGAFVVQKKLKRRRSAAARRDDFVGPTPETLAKLRQDPLLALFERYDSDGGGDGEKALEHAADEIRAIYLAVYGMLMAGVGGRHRYGDGPGGRRDIPPFLAWAHAKTYTPWANGIKRTTLEAVIDLVVERNLTHPERMIAVAEALGDYARRLRHRPAFKNTE